MVRLGARTVAAMVATAVVASACGACVVVGGEQDAEAVAGDRAVGVRDVEEVVEATGRRVQASVPVGGAVDGVGGEDDGEAGFDGVALVVVDRPGLQVVPGHAECFFDLPELVAGADDEAGRDRCAAGAGGEAGEVALQPG